MDFELTDDQIAIRDMVRDLARKEIAPHATKWDEHQHFFFAPFDNRHDLAVYVSHADYRVPDANVWVDDLTVTQSGWARLVWEGYVRGSW